MRLKLLQDNWNRMGIEDPLWAVCTAPQYKGRKWDEARFFDTGRHDVRVILDEASARGIEFPRRAALDFGCGVGRLSQALAGSFDTVTGVDLAPAMLEHARAYNQFGDRVTYRLNVEPDLSLWSDNTFDFVLSEITLMHMEPRFFSAYIAEFVRICRPEGVVAFQLPGTRRRQMIREKVPRPIWEAVQQIRTWNEPRMEIYGMDPKEVRALIAEHGGQVLGEVDLDLDGVHDLNRRYFVRPTG